MVSTPGSRRLEPVTLEGSTVRLEPLALLHLAPLSEVAFDEALWRYSPTPPVRNPAELRDYIQSALSEAASGLALPFATVHRSDTRVVGSTRFGNYVPEHRRVEIGWTWLARPWQRSEVNTEAKYLMLGYAFDVLECIRVEFKTDDRNEQSLRALARLGAVEEGRFRNHMITAGGEVRHTVWFSITAEEWPAIRRRLEDAMRARR
ncbi:MAG: GNAT family N-acetyltransferase [Gemmatimonadales bacterium]|nr:GNAT family N-acetyltransferase [Gemmatimonadales bacterium]